jgi:hypothetical protein
MTACELFANCIRHGLLNFELYIQLHLPIMAYRQMFVVGADPDIWDFVQLSEYIGHTSTTRHRLRELCS